MTELRSPPWDQLRWAMEGLKSSIYKGDSVKDAYLELDTIASTLREIYPDLVSAEADASPSTVFQALVRSDRDFPEHAVADAARLQELSSRKWYDNGSSEEEGLLDEAESRRDSLWSALSTFIEAKQYQNRDQGVLIPEPEEQS